MDVIFVPDFLATPPSLAQSYATDHTLLVQNGNVYGSIVSVRSGQEVGYI